MVLSLHIKQAFLCGFGTKKACLKNGSRSFFHAAISHFSVFLCSETAQKRVLRRLNSNKAAYVLPMNITKHMQAVNSHHHLCQIKPCNFLFQHIIILAK